MYPTYMLGTWLVSFLVFAAFWFGIGTLLVWVSKSSIKERNLLLTGLTLVAGALFFATVAGFSMHMNGYSGFGGMMGGYGAGGWMMGGYPNW